ncbi:hypothetical protein [Neisseria sp.]|nr:hypothetical protein [Neisseria sp.]MDO4227584.1 hypothetical protein [Neisseria sp.]
MMKADTDLNGVADRDNLPLAQEPDSVKRDWEAVKAQFAKP